MKYLRDSKIVNINVLLRCDFNVPVKDGIITDNSKIIKSLDTIKYLLDNGNRVIIFSHFGRVKNEEDKKDNTLFVVYEELKKYIDIDFIRNPLNIEEVTDVSTKKCFLVENTRFTDLPNKRESANDLELASYWAKFGDAFVLDAFASSHRVHSSTAGIAKYLPTYLGFLMEKEIKGLEPLVYNNEHPYLVIMGGAKVDDKIDIINGLIEKCDTLVLTGGILNTFLKVMGSNVGDSLVSNDEKVINNVKTIIDNYKNKLFFSNKFIVKRDNDVIEVGINDIIDRDVIYDNIIDLDNMIRSAKIIFMNGTTGKYEEKEYETGTKSLLQNLTVNNNVYIGGGDTISAVNKFDFTEKYRYLSSGGGVTLEYIATQKLKAVSWIKENSVENS